MKHIFIIFISIFLFFFPLGNTHDVFCADMKGMITLDLRNIDIIDALKFLAMKSGMNIVTSKNVSGRINLMVKDVSIRDVFDIMLRSNGLAYDKRGDIYSVMSEEEYKTIYGKAFGDVRIVKLFHLEYAIPDQVFSLCDSLKSEIGRVIVDPESGAVVLMDSPQKIEEIGQVIKEFEQKNIVKVFSINYASASTIAEKLKGQLDTKKAGSIRADEQTNQIIVQTLPERMKQIEEIVKKLDRKTKQVMIDTKIIKVKLLEFLTESVEWEGLFGLAEKSGLAYLGSYPFSAVQASTDAWRSRKEVYETVGHVGSYPFSGTSTSQSASSPKIGLEEMHIGFIGDQDFDIIIRYFKDVGETQIVSTPKIVVTNNQEASIHVGEKQAYVTTTTTTGQTTSTVSEEVTFVDVGTMLHVTPTINEEGYITLKLKTEISNVVSVLVTPTGNRIPIIGTSVAETTVMTKDNTTIVIGGLRRMEKGLEVRKVPVLGSLPFLGKLFTARTPRKGRTELLIMITPTIITGDVLVGSKNRVVGKRALKSIKDYEYEDKKQDKDKVETKSSKEILSEKRGDEKNIKGLKF